MSGRPTPASGAGERRADGHRALRWRLLAASCVAALALGLAACGDDDDEGGNGETTTAKQKSTKAKKVDLPPFPTGARFFANTSPWNTPIDTVPADPRSVQMLDLAKRRVGTVELPGQEPRSVNRLIRAGVALNTRAWAPVIVEVNRKGGVPTRLMCRQLDCGPGIQVPESLPLPPGSQPDPRYDGWMSLIDRANGLGYDLWRARRQDNGTITFQYSKAWALDGPGFSRPVSVAPARAVGARGSGLPLFAGVVEPSELQAGEIDHALAISVPGLARRRYVQPASVTDGIGPPRALPAGARLRLRADVRLPERNRGRDRNIDRAAEREFDDERDFDGEGELDRDRDLDGDGDIDEQDRNLENDRNFLTDAERRYAEAVMAALRRYGAIVVDRAAVPTLYGQYGTLDQLIDGDELEWLSLDDFEVLALPPVMLDPPAGREAATRAAGVFRPATRGGF